MTRTLFRSLCLTVLLTVSTGPTSSAQDAPPPGPPKSTPMAEPLAAPTGDGTGVRLATDKGDIVIGLFTESAPVASENFLNLAGSGFYDDVTFHRLVPGFVIQGGDPEGTGLGGPGYTIEDEPVVGRYGRGIVAMARTRQPHSQGSQFFIVLDDVAERALEAARTYAIFGRVVEGMDVVDAIAAMPNSGGDENRALEPVTINAATIEQVTLPPEPERPPLEAAGPTGDPELEAMLPATVGDVPLSTTSFTAREILGSAAPDDPITELRDVIEAAGGTVDDFSLATGQADVDGSLVLVFAARLKGSDAAQLVERLPGVLGFVGEPPSTTELAGRPVTVVAPYADAPVAERVHVWTDGDTVWMVLAPEPHLSEIAATVGEE